MSWGWTVFSAWVSSPMVHHSPGHGPLRRLTWEPNRPESPQPWKDLNRSSTSLCWFEPRFHSMHLQNLAMSWEREIAVCCRRPSLKRFFNPYPRTSLLILERGEGRERNINVRVKHWSVASCMHPDWGPNPQPRHVPWQGTTLATFQSTGRCSEQLNHTGQGSKETFVP